MAGTQVFKTGSFVIDLASKIQELGNNWYKASAAWEEFPLQVGRLRTKHEFWQAEFTKFGMSSDISLIQCLEEAKLSLEKEEAKLSKREAKKRSAKEANRNTCGPGCWPKLSMTIFPSQVGLSIETAIRAFDNIPASMRYQEEAAAALEKRQLRRAVSVLVRKDDRYVPLQVSETAVRSALEIVNLDDSPTVVLLHGGPGKGKSTLARAVALHYKEGADKAAGFEHVVYLECGPQADILAKQFKLLQMFGAVEIAPLEQLQQSHLIIRKRIKGHLRDQRVLIIFDDVWEGNFLHMMVELCGNRVTCLVTSQLGDLCTGLSFAPKKIQIEDVQPKDARKILASHLRLPNHIIPENVQKIVDKLIQETEGNPLALASIAAAIDNTRSDELEVWEAASSNLLEMLQNDSRALGYILDKKYPRSFWSTMKLSFNSLDTDARNLLMLVHMCGGVSVPEEVIQVLYQSEKVGPTTFTKLRMELESRQLVEITLTSESPVKQRSWSMHSLQKLFIEEEMKDSIELTFISLVDQDIPSIEIGSTPLKTVGGACMVDKDVKIALATIYFNKQFAVRASTKMGIDITSKFYNVRCSAIEQVTRLLGQPLSDRWTEELLISTKQVFMRYISNGVLDAECTLNLLQSPVSVLAMITTIKDIATIEETSLLDERSHGFMKALIDLLLVEDGGNNATIREAAGEALASLCENDVDGEYIITKIPSVLEAVVKVLSSDSHDSKISSLAGRILAYLTGGVEDETSLRTIVDYLGSLVCLVKSLCQIRNPSLQSYAARILVNLAYRNHDRQLKIVHSSGALEELIKSLSKDNNPDLQKYTATALANLASGDGEIKLKLINTNGAIEELVKSLSKNHNPPLQEQAAKAMANLASSANSGGEIDLKIINSIGALEALVKSLSQDDNLCLQESAARALVNLAAGDGKVKFKIINSIGALEALVKSLSKDKNPYLQEYVASTLANLALGDGEIKLKIINSIGALEALVKSLSKDDKPRLQDRAAKALDNLGDKIDLKFINSIGIVEELDECLSKEDNPSLQKHARRALVKLRALDMKEG